MTSPADQIYQIIQQLRANQQGERISRERQWIVSHLADPDLQALVPKLSVISLHILSVLAAKDQQTGMMLAEQLRVTRGGISRAAKKLQEVGLVTAAKHPENQKSLYYAITPAGKAIAQVHDQMHQDFNAQVVNQLTAKYSSADLQLVASFLADLQAAEEQF